MAYRRAATGGGGWGWILGGLAVLVGVVVATQPSEAERQRQQRARRIRQDADAALLRRLEAIAADGRLDVTKRSAADTGARLFRLLWINPGHSGSALPVEFKLKIYGSWCGPGYGGGPCVDEIDCLCRDHDQQYQLAAHVEAGWA